MKRPIPFPGSAGAGDPGDPLDALLGRLPEPSVPNDLAERTLSQVRAEAALDQLLERGLAAEAPPGLAQRVLAGLAEQRWAPPELTGRGSEPRGALLAQRRATALAAASTGSRRRLGSRRMAPWMLVGAAACLLVGWMVLLGPWERRGQPRTDIAQAPQADFAPHSSAHRDGSAQAQNAELQPAGDIPDAELLQVLDLLENWETLTDPAVLALELEADAAWWDELEAALEGSLTAEDSDEG
jgi:hypothetical protein